MPNSDRNDAASSREHARLVREAQQIYGRPSVFKVAIYGPGPHMHPTLVVDCPTCGSPAGCYCNDDDGRPIDGPHIERKHLAGTAERRAA